MSQIPHSSDDHGPGLGPADPVDTRQLEKSVSWSRGERFRWLWYRLRLTVAEMNYASRRVAELQAHLPPDNPSARQPRPSAPRTNRRRHTT